MTNGDFLTTPSPLSRPTANHSPSLSNRSKPDPDRNYNSDIWTVRDNVARSAAPLPTKAPTSPKSPLIPAPTVSLPGLPTANGSPTASQIDVQSHRSTPPTTSPSLRHRRRSKSLSPSYSTAACAAAFPPRRQLHLFHCGRQAPKALPHSPSRGGESRVHWRSPCSLLVFTRQSGAIAAQIRTLDALTKSFFRMATISPPHQNQRRLASQLRLSQVDYVHFKSKDGTPIAGYLYKPIDYTPGKKVPTLLNPHGGPVGQYSASFYHLAQLYAANGYAVLLPNPRGSSGYGQKFCEAIFADWGNKDFQDDMAMVDYAVAQGIADPDKLGVAAGPTAACPLTSSSPPDHALQSRDLRREHSPDSQRLRPRSISERLLLRTRLPLGKQSRLGKSLALLSRQQHHHPRSFHGW